MSRYARLMILSVVLCVGVPRAALAGMASFAPADLRRTFTLVLTDPSRMRLEAISFFLLTLLLCAGAIRGIWNAFAREVAWLPRLSYVKALGVVFLWGLLFVLVLTMISGARELMTPGAWEKQGLTYRLKHDRTVAVERQISARFRAIERIRDALYRHIDGEMINFPKALPQPLREMPGAAGAEYIYVGARINNDFDGPLPMVYEGDAFGPDRLVLLRSGSIVWMPISEIERAVSGMNP